MPKFKRDELSYLSFSDNFGEMIVEAVSQLNDIDAKFGELEMITENSLEKKKKKNTRKSKLDF